MADATRGGFGFLANLHCGFEWEHRERARGGAPELCPYVGWSSAEDWQTTEKRNRNIQGGNTSTCCDGQCCGGYTKDTVVASGCLNHR